MYYELKVESRSEEDKKIRDVFIVEDETTTSAEASLYKYLEEEEYSEFEITHISKKKYSDIILRDKQDSV
jgi:predicted PhzF superfamily epimerase YddE/YHI9